MIRHLDIVAGAQFGSEAKGHISAQLNRARRNQTNPTPNRATIRVAGPNAGHSAKGCLDGQIWALRTIPVVAVVDPTTDLILAAGSEIDPEVLEAEITMLDQAGYRVSDRLLISEQATILTPDHKLTEATAQISTNLGSTGKGIGAARAARLMRHAPLANQDPYTRQWTTPDPVAGLLNSRQAYDVLLEGTQGYGLGLHAGHYPYCTSSDTRAIDFLAMAGLNPWDRRISRTDTWLVARTYPIRVAGNSGQLNDELDWTDLAERSNGYIQPERTTVTKKIRRIGEWDLDLVRAAILANGGNLDPNDPDPHVHLIVSFLDYIDPTIANSDILSPKATRWLDHITDELTYPAAVTTGPDTIVWLQDLPTA